MGNGRSRHQGRRQDIARARRTRWRERWPVASPARSRASIHSFHLTTIAATLGGPLETYFAPLMDSEQTLNEASAGVLRLPLELLETILDLLGRKDLLSLALTCSPLRDAIIPRHLHFRVIVASEFHAPLWAYLASRPDLARNVHQLTLFNRSEVAHASFKDRPTMLLPPCFKMVEGLGLLCGMRPLLMRNGSIADGRELERTALTMALKSMIGLRSLSIRASGCVLADEITAGRDLFSLACRAVPNVETLRVTWSRPVYAPDFFELFPYPTPAIHPVCNSTLLHSLA